MVQTNSRIRFEWGYADSLSVPSYLSRGLFCKMHLALLLFPFSFISFYLDELHDLYPMDKPALELHLMSAVGFYL